MNDDVSTPPAEEPAAAPTDAVAAPPPEFLVEVTRRPGQEPITLAVEDQETADQLRGRIRDGMRRADFLQAMAVVERRRLELDLVAQRIEVPIEFLMSQDPSIQLDVVRHLLSVPGIWDTLSPELAELLDETARMRRQDELAQVRRAARRAAEAEIVAIATGRTDPRPETVESPTPQADPQPDRPVRVVHARRVH